MSWKTFIAQQLEKLTGRVINPSGGGRALDKQEATHIADTLRAALSGDTDPKKPQKVVRVGLTSQSKDDGKGGAER